MRCCVTTLSTLITRAKVMPITLLIVEMLAMSPSAVPDSYGQEEQFGGLPTIHHLIEAKLTDMQRFDQCIKYAVSQIRHGDSAPFSLHTQLPDHPLLHQELNDLEPLNHILYR